jgi:hypothetical protein
MGRVFGWSRALEHAMDRKLVDHETIKEGDAEVMEDSVYPAKKGVDPVTGIWSEERVLKTRKRYNTVSAMAHLESQEHHYKGDPVVIEGTSAKIRDGEMTYRFERIDPVSGKPKGTYEGRMVQDGEGRMVYAGARRVHD